MKKVKMINRVPLPKADGTSYLPMESDECEVTDSVAQALERGGDAKIVGDVKAETLAEVTKPKAEPEAEKDEEQDKKPKSSKNKRQTKDNGAAPENK